MQDTTGLRERKKAETRTAISRAVMRLALERGLDAVNADDIAAAANVSVRTFHNYFASKQEALVAAWRSEFQVHVTALRERPADEPILVSLEHVFGGIADQQSRTSRTPRRRRSTSCGPASPLRSIDRSCSTRRSEWSSASSRTAPGPTRRPTSTPTWSPRRPSRPIVTSFQFAPAGSPAEPDRDRLLHECFELLRAGLVRVEGVRMPQ